MKKGAPWNVQKKRDGDREAREMWKETERERGKETWRESEKGRGKKVTERE